jgi:hypothetical protein
LWRWTLFLYDEVFSKLMEETTMRKLIEVRLDSLDPNPYRDLENNPLDGGRVADLRKSVASTGFWENVIVRPHPDRPGRYQLAFGHHRVAAVSKELGTDRLVKVICDENLTDMVMLKMMARENGDYCQFPPAFCVECVRHAKTMITDAEKLATDFNLEAWMVNYLEWPRERVQASLSLINAIDKGKVAWEAIKKCSTLKAAKKFSQEVKTAAKEGAPLAPATQLAVAEQVAEKIAEKVAASDAVESAIQAAAQQSMAEKVALPAPGEPSTVGIHDPLIDLPPGESISPSKPRPAGLLKEAKKTTESLTKKLQTVFEYLERLDRIRVELGNDDRFLAVIDATKLQKKTERIHVEIDEFLEFLESDRHPTVVAVNTHPPKAKRRAKKAATQDDLFAALPAMGAAEPPANPVESSAVVNVEDDPRFDEASSLLANEPGISLESFTGRLRMGNDRAARLYGHLKEAPPTLPATSVMPNTDVDLD